MVVDAVFKKYILQDLVSKIELRRALNSIIMNREEDPTNLFEVISGIDNTYNTATINLQKKRRYQQLWRTHQKSTVMC